MRAVKHWRINALSVKLKTVKPGCPLKKGIACVRNSQWDMQKKCSQAQNSFVLASWKTNAHEQYLSPWPWSVAVYWSSADATTHPVGWQPGSPSTPQSFLASETPDPHTQLHVAHYTALDMRAQSDLLVASILLRQG